ncbi:MAG: hypothetical protein ACJ8AW_25640 [Rhodopila sp.]
MTKLIHLLIAACVAVGLAAPAYASGTKATKHSAKMMKQEAPKSPTDMLNAQSLQAAQGGQNFMLAAPK